MGFGGRSPGHPLLLFASIRSAVSIGGLRHYVLDLPDNDQAACDPLPSTVAFPHRSSTLIRPVTSSGPAPKAIA